MIDFELQARGDDGVWSSTGMVLKGRDFKTVNNAFTKEFIRRGGIMDKVRLVHVSGEVCND